MTNCRTRKESQIRMQIRIRYASKMYLYLYLVECGPGMYNTFAHAKCAIKINCAVRSERVALVTCLRFMLIKAGASIEPHVPPPPPLSRAFVYRPSLSSLFYASRFFLVLVSCAFACAVERNANLKKFNRNRMTHTLTQTWYHFQSISVLHYVIPIPLRFCFYCNSYGLRAGRSYRSSHCGGSSLGKLPTDREAI